MNTLTILKQIAIFTYNIYCSFTKLCQSFHNSAVDSLNENVLTI